MRCLPGERGSLVITYAVYERDAQEKERGTAEEAEPEKRGFVKGYTVFNASQIDGIDFPSPPGVERPPIEAAEAIVMNMPDAPVIIEGPERVPHYLPALDIVKMPERRRFLSMERFYQVLYHELVHEPVHASGSERRLARKTLIENRGMFAAGAEDKKTYCLEELVAEMGAAFLCARARVDSDGHENSATYLQGWLEGVITEKGKKCTLSPPCGANGRFDRGGDGFKPVHAPPLSFLGCRARLSFPESAVGG